MSNLKFQNWSCELSKQTQLFFIIIQKKKLIKEDFESKAETSDRKAEEQWKASPGLHYLETQPINVLNISPGVLHNCNHKL